MVTRTRRLKTVEDGDIVASNLVWMPFFFIDAIYDSSTIQDNKRELDA